MLQDRGAAIGFGACAGRHVSGVFQRVVVERENQQPAGVKFVEQLINCLRRRVLIGDHAHGGDHLILALGEGERIIEGDHIQTAVNSGERPRLFNHFRADIRPIDGGVTLRGQGLSRQTRAASNIKNSNITIRAMTHQRFDNAARRLIIVIGHGLIITGRPIAIHGFCFGLIFQLIGAFQKRIVGH